MSDQATNVSREELTAQLSHEIMSGSRHPGSRLPSERQLSEDSGLSRPTVREVLGSLQERGLVEVTPGRGAFVRRPSVLVGAGPMAAAYWRSRATPAHLVAARRSLEETTAVEAARNAVAADVDALERVVEQCEQASDVLTQARYDIGFHFLIARTAGNPVLEILFGSLTPLIFELLLRSLSDSAVKAAGIPQHRAMLEAIRQRDSEQARTLMHAHLELAANLYGADYREPLDQVARRALERTLGPNASLEALVERTVQEAFAVLDDAR